MIVAISKALIACGTKLDHGLVINAALCILSERSNQECLAKQRLAKPS
jgi:hypothetical protein